MPKAAVFHTKRYYFNENCLKKIENSRYKWPPVTPEVKLPESELLRNEIKLPSSAVPAGFLYLNIFLKSNVYTQFTIFIGYNPLLNLSLLWLWYRVSKNNKWYLGDLMTWYFLQTSACNRKNSLRQVPFTIVTLLGSALLTRVLE